MTEFSTELSYHWVWDKEQYDHHLDDPLSKYELSEVYKLNFEIYSYKEILLSKAYIAGQQVMSFFMQALIEVPMKNTMLFIRIPINQFGHSRLMMNTQ